MPSKTKPDGSVWRDPMTHWDRSRNCLNLSREDLDRMCKLAEEHPALREVMEEAKMLWLLLDDNRRDDALCYPVHIGDKVNGEFVPKQR